MSNAPVKKFRIGYVTASVWKNETTDRPFYSVTVERTYKDDDGNLQNTASFGHADLPVVIKVLDRAEAYLASL